MLIPNDEQIAQLLEQEVAQLAEDNVLDEALEALYAQQHKDERDYHTAQLEWCRNNPSS